MKKKNFFRNLYEKYIPNENFPVIIDAEGKVIHGMVLPAKDMYGDVLFTKDEITIHDDHFILVPGHFSMNAILTGIIYYYSNIKLLEEQGLIQIKKGTSKDFVDSFYKGAEE